MKTELLLPMFKLKYRNLHQPHCSHINNTKGGMKDEKLLYFRKAKMHLGVYETHLDGTKE